MNHGFPMPQPLLISPNNQTYIMNGNSMRLISPVTVTDTFPSNPIPTVPYPIVQQRMVTPSQIMCQPPPAPAPIPAVLDLNQLPNNTSVLVTNYNKDPYGYVKSVTSIAAPVNTYPTHSTTSYQQAPQVQSTFQPPQPTFQQPQPDFSQPRTPTTNSSNPLNAFAFEFHPVGRGSADTGRSELASGAAPMSWHKTSEKLKPDDGLKIKEASATTPAWHKTSEKLKPKLIDPNLKTDTTPVTSAQTASKSATTKASTWDDMSISSKELPQDDPILKALHDKSDKAKAVSRLESVYKSPATSSLPNTPSPDPKPPRMRRNKKNTEDPKKPEFQKSESKKPPRQRKLSSPKRETKTSNSPKSKAMMSNSAKTPPTDRGVSIQNRANGSWTTIEPLANCEFEFAETSAVFELSSNTREQKAASAKEDKPTPEQNEKKSVKQETRKAEVSIKPKPQPSPKVAPRFVPKQSQPINLLPTASEFIPSTRKASIFDINAPEFIPVHQDGEQQDFIFEYDPGSLSPYSETELYTGAALYQPDDVYQCNGDVDVYYDENGFDMQTGDMYGQNGMTFEEQDFYADSFQYEDESHVVEDLSIQVEQLPSPNFDDAGASSLASPSEDFNRPMAPIEQRGGAFYFDPSIQVEKRKRLTRRSAALPILPPKTTS